MQFELEKAIEILERTPIVLEQLLNGLSKDWIYKNEGEDTWSPYDVLGHLIHGEKTDWIPRVKLIMSDSQSKNFEPFDRYAQFNENKQKKSMEALLAEFKSLRIQNLKILKEFKIDKEDLALIGTHPDFGTVTLQQLLATWVVHDLNHLSQISRVMAKNYSNEVGPWQAYLRILQN